QVTVSVDVSTSAAARSVSVTATLPSGSPITAALARVGTSITYSGTVTLPGNAATTAAVYHFTVSASDTAGGSAQADGGTVSVSVPANPPPVISNPQLSPRSLLSTGGTVTISAQVTDDG